MPLQKQNLAVNFAQGLDTKTDPKQVQPGKFLSLENSIFTKAGLLQKRNGFEELTALPDGSYEYVNTFNENLTAIGTNLAAYSDSSQSWVVKGEVAPIQLDTLPLIRNSSNQTQVDTAVSSSGLICTVYTSTSPSTTRSYAIADVVTGQNIVSPTVIPSASEGARVFVLGNYFIILYSETTNLKYIAVPINDPSNPGAVTTLITNYQAGASELAFDGAVANNSLYVAYNAPATAIRMTYLNSFLVRQTAATGTVVAAAKDADIMSVSADTSGTSPIIWATFYKTSSTTGWSLAVDQQLTSVVAATVIISALTVVNLATAAQDNINSIVYEISQTYSYGASLPTNKLQKTTISTGGSITAANRVMLSVGLASKAFFVSDKLYVLAAYFSAYQPSYFLIDCTSLGDGTARTVGRLAYSNGGGYLTLGLPSVTVTGTVAQIGYLIKDLVVATNKNQSPTSSTPVYTQTGINLVSFDFTTDGMNASEIGANLNISGAIMTAFDGYQVAEQGFNVYPDNVIVTTSTTGGSLKDQTYYYQAVYEWTDNQGNIHRSAPSLPFQQVTTGGNASTNTVNVPTLRLTQKTLVKIVIYRWSTDNQTYYQITSITSPLLNDTSINSVSFVDTQADASIVGNSIIYTTGGVVENIATPSAKVMTLYKSRLFMVDGEDQNLLWYSKQVIEGTPVEMSDLFTVYVAPTISAQGNTGPITALSAMDDKLIIFKKNAIYYMTGTGPDNTGANNDFSDPVFITSTIGCSLQNSIVFMPNGLMFQSDKGIWLLGRDLSTTYIGAPVEDFNADPVLSALSIPETNQVRFTLLSGAVLMYDYFFGQWGTFVGIPSVSSTLYQNMHTYIDSYGRTFQELPESFVDGARPVLMSFTTGWFNLAGLQGFERAYFFYLLGQYITPHKLSVSVAYDYNSSPTQISIISPDNYSPAYGGDTLYGSSSPYGGPGNIEQWRVFLQKQKCQAFQITVEEIYDPNFGVGAGAGLTMSGIDLVVGMKGTYPRLKMASNSVG